MNTRSITHTAIVLGLCLLSTLAGAQALPEAPQKVPAGAGAYNYLYRAGWVCGTGASHSSVATRPNVQCGAMFAFMPFLDAELGVMSPQANQQKNGSGYLSISALAPLASPRRAAHLGGLPLLVGGYTRIFETGNAVNYGVAFAHPVDERHSIQFEVRDYLAFSNPAQHDVVLRVMWITGLPD